MVKIVPVFCISPVILKGRNIGSETLELQFYLELKRKLKKGIVLCKNYYLSLRSGSQKVIELVRHVISTLLSSCRISILIALKRARMHFIVFS